MNKNRYFLTLFAVTILAGLVALGACQSTEDVQPLALVPVAGVDADFNFEQAAENKAYRWIEMAKAYERNGLLNKETHPDEVLAFRWNAMAEAYERHGLLNDQTDPDEILAYRWNAMAEAYQRNGLLNFDSNPDDVMAYRWSAMAKFYDDNGLLVEANDYNDDSVAFRWSAMARFYEENDLLTRDSTPSELVTHTVASQEQ